MSDIQKQIELLLRDFEMKLSEIGINAESAAMLLQLQLAGIRYIKHFGDLNQLAGTTMSLKSTNHCEDRDFYVFFAHEVESMLVAESTRRNHRDTLRLLQNFKPLLHFSELNHEFIISFESYMITEQYAVNTIARHMKVLKQYINRAIVHEHIQISPFRKYKIRSAETKRESLSEKELSLLECYHQRLEERNEVLDAFLFSCYSGLRYSDICRLTKQHIISVNKKRWIVIRMQKTDTDIRVPIYLIFEGKGLELLKKIRRPRGILFQLQNSQMVNREIKKICRKVGIKRHITFHSARHTCATLLLYNGVNITTVQKILGHKSVKTTQIYSAVTDLTIEREIRKSNSGKKKKASKHAIIGKS